MGTTEMESALANWVNWVCARLNDNSSQLTAVWSNSQFQVPSVSADASDCSLGDHLPYWPVNVVTCLRPQLSPLGLVVCLLLLLLDELTNLSHLAEFLQPLLRLVAFPAPAGAVAFLLTQMITSHCRFVRVCEYVCEQWEGKGASDQE